MVLSSYYTPTRVTFGIGAEEAAATELIREGARNVLIHYGSDRVIRNGLIEGVERRLDEAGIRSTRLGGVVPNPRLSLVRKGIELCRSEKIDFILAVGGGSVIDSAKCIGYGVAYDGDVWDFYSQKATPKASLPVGCILTMAAAGSEMSDSSVITNEDQRCMQAALRTAQSCPHIHPALLSDSLRHGGHHDAHHGAVLHWRELSRTDR